MIERDTRPSAQAIQLEILRKLGPEKRVNLAASMSEDARRIALEAIKRRHPEFTEREARLALFRQLWGDEVFERVWGRQVLRR